MQVPEVLFLRPTVDSTAAASAADSMLEQHDAGPPRRSVRDVVTNLRPAGPQPADIKIEPTARSLNRGFTMTVATVAPCVTTNSADEPFLESPPVAAETRSPRVTRSWPPLIERLAVENPSAWSAVLARIPANAVVGCLGLQANCGTTTVAATLALCRSEAAAGRDVARRGWRHRPHEPSLNPGNRRTATQDVSWPASGNSVQSAAAADQAPDPQTRWRVDPPHSLSAPQFLIDANIDRPALATRLEIEADGTWPEWTTHAVAPNHPTTLAAAATDLPATGDLKIWPLRCALVPSQPDNYSAATTDALPDSIRYYLPPQAAGPILHCLTNLISQLHGQGCGVVLDLGHLPLWQRLMWLPTLSKIVQHLVLVVPANPDAREVSRAYWQLQDYGLTSCQLIENQRPSH